ncbi:MAG: 2-oxoacid:acceptor oxidoreductase family protein [Desulfobacterales bacterium]|jgi:2-oxoglutarate ferredoxin oxidoreductase subunit gamma|nr:2-oxoacid:acceptor oxidoreductase family protein [Desulfobacterales bacterium]
MQREVQFAGFGGQGIMLMGQILAQAAMDQGYEVVWIPSYGPEMRGGTAYCTVVISDRPIGSPIIRNPKHLVAMNRPSLEKFAPTVQAGGTIFINSSIISIDADRDDVDVIKVPIIEIAKELGNIKTANIVALAAFVSRSQVVDFELLRESVKNKFAKREKLIPLNMKALEAGQKAARA